MFENSYLDNLLELEDAEVVDPASNYFCVHLHL